MGNAIKETHKGLRWRMKGRPFDGVAKTCREVLFKLRVKGWWGAMEEHLVLPSFLKGSSTKRSLLTGDVKDVSGQDQYLEGMSCFSSWLLFPPYSLVPWIHSLPHFSAISLDKLLDAGLYTGEMTEIAGGPGSGKTQVHMQPAARRIGGGRCTVLFSWESFCQWLEI